MQRARLRRQVEEQRRPPFRGGHATDASQLGGDHRILPERGEHAQPVGRGVRPGDLLAQGLPVFEEQEHRVACRRFGSQLKGGRLAFEPFVRKILKGKRVDPDRLARQLPDANENGLRRLHRAPVSLGPGDELGKSADAFGTPFDGAG